MTKSEGVSNLRPYNLSVDLAQQVHETAVGRSVFVVDGPVDGLGDLGLDFEEPLPRRLEPLLSAPMLM